MKALPLLLILIAGCASYKSHNQTTTGKVVMRGGIYQKETWEDKLVFKRMSWYYGMTLFFDTLIWRAVPESPFSKWFSESEKEFFTKCEKLLVTVSYSADPTKISHVNFREQMKLNGYDDVVLNNFAAFLKTHPGSQEWRTLNYKVMGYCKRSPSRLNTPSIGINFPSFQYLEVKL
ncbi:MAG: hypothetical protein H0V66_01345 [Bdellovibrionales bacterium]|nr:hypothetical protein [Bdellovibrionales bacterium]